MAAQISIVRYPDDLLDRRLHDGEGDLADFANGDAVGEDADAIERDPSSGLERLVHRVGFVRFDADDPDVRAQRLDVAGDAGDEAAAADRDEDRGDVAQLVAQDLVGDRSLPGDDERIVEGMHEREAGLANELVASCLGFGVAVAGQDDFRPERAHGLDLDLGRGLRHDDERPQAEMAGGERHALGVVAGARRDDATRALGIRHVRDPVVRAAQLVAEDRLQVLALEQDLVLQPARQVDRRLERGLVGDVIHPAGQDQPEHRVGGGVGFRHKMVHGIHHSW